MVQLSRQVFLQGIDADAQSFCGAGFVVAVTLVDSLAVGADGVFEQVAGGGTSTTTVVSR